MSSGRFTATNMRFAVVFAWLLLNGTPSNCLQAQTVVAAMQNGESVSGPIPTVAAAPELLIQTPMFPTQEFVQQSQSPNDVPQAATALPEASPSCAHGPNCQCNSFSNQRRTYSSYRPSHLQKKQANYWGYPEYFCEPGLGSSVYAALQAQKHRGVVEQTTLYRCDFYPEGSPLASQLTPYGKRRLEKLACRAILSSIPLRIERCADNDELDNMRRQFVAEHSAENNLGWTADMVCLVDVVSSVSGTEALIHYRNLLMQTTAGPSSGSSSSNTRDSTRGNSAASAGNGSPPTTR